MPIGLIIDILIPIIIFLLTIVIARFVRDIIKKNYKRVVRSEKNIVTIDQTHYAIVSRLVVVLVYAIGIFFIIYQIEGLRTFFYSALAGAGVLAIAIGFATRDVFSNIMSGISIAAFEPFRVGDVITVKDQTGKVEDVTLRHTVVRTWENKRIVLPNSVVSNEILVNSTINDPKLKKAIDISISYESDLNKAKRLMLDEARKHPGSLSWTEKLPRGKEEERGPGAYVVGLGDSGVNLRLYFWAKDFVDSHTVAWELMENTKKRFQKEAIEIPYPHRMVLYKKETKHKRKK